MTGGVKRRARRYKVPRGFLGPQVVQRIVPSVSRARDRGRLLVAIFLGVALHGALAVGAWRTAVTPRAAKVLITQNVQIERPKPPPPPPAPPPEEPQPPPPRPTRQARHATQPPAAAVAGRIVARAEQPDQPLDFTGFDMVVGKGDTYAGGYTASTGTSKAAVANPAATAHGTGPPDASRARPPVPSRKDWACGWPEDAQESDIRDARASIRVHVDRDGEAQGVDIVSSPSPSFAEAARHCALSETYRTALDDAGHSVAGITPIFIVHFVR
jgi:protein TonB